MNDSKQDYSNNKEIKLTSEQTDILKELGNIGSGNAITALSQLLNRRIEISLTSIDIVPFWKLPYLLGAEDLEVFGILSKIKGKNDIRLLQIYPKISVIRIINSLTEFKKENADKIRVAEDLNDFSISIILEIGNILAGHYLSALANLLSIKLIPDVPDLALDNITALTNCIIAKYSQKLDFAIMIETTLKIEELELDGILCFVPSIETVDRFLKVISAKFNI